MIENPTIVQWREPSREWSVVQDDPADVAGARPSRFTFYLDARVSEGQATFLSGKRGTAVKIPVMEGVAGASLPVSLCHMGGSLR
jgi:hypothetical protein